MPRRLISTSAVLLAVAAGACSTGAESSDDFIKEFCAVLEGCCHGDGQPFNTSTCSGWLTLGASGAVYDAEAGAECLEEMRAAGCESLLGSSSDSEASGRGDACERVFQAPQDGVAPGDACEIGTPCSSPSGGDAVCVYRGEGEGGVCQERLRGAEGDAPCVEEFDDTSVSARLYDCTGDLYCDFSSKACVRKAPLGEPCGGRDCVDGAICMNGICTALAKEGERCFGEAPPCGESLYCSEEDERCAPQRAEGEPCAIWTECSSRDCTSEGVCGPDPSAGGSAGMCGILGGSFSGSDDDGDD